MAWRTLDRLFTFRTAAVGFLLLAGVLLTPAPAVSSEEKPSKLESIRTLIADNEFAEAASQARALLTETEVAKGRDSLEAARVLDLLTESLWRGGKANDPGARGMAERAIQIKEKLLGPGHLEVATSQNNLGNLLFQMGDYGRARKAFERVLAIREKSLGPAHPDVAKILSNLGAVDFSTGDFKSAKAMYDRSLNIRERKFGPEHPEVAKVLNNIALLLQETGDYAQARQLSERALAIREKSLDPEDPQISQSLNNLANLLFTTGDYTEAKRLYERALAMREKAASDSDDPNVAASLNNLANDLLELGDREGAKPLLEQALKIRESLYGPDHKDVAASLSNLANFLKEAGDYAAARPLYERAMQIWEKVLGADYRDVTAGLTSLAYLRWVDGDFAGAKTLYGRAVTVAESSLGPSHPEVGINLNTLADFLARTGEKGEALQAALRAEEIGREHVRLTARTLTEREALRYAAIRATGLDVSLSLAGEGLEPASVRRVWNTLIKSRALVLDEMANRHRAVNEARDPITTRLSKDLASARQRLANLTLRGPELGKPVKDYLAILDQARREKEKAEQALAEGSLAFRRRQAGDRADVASIAAQLPPESALLAFVLYNRSDLSRKTPGPAKHSGGSAMSKDMSPDSTPSYLAFVLRGGASGDPKAVPLGPVDEIDRGVARWSREAGRGPEPAGGSPEQAEAAYRDAGDALRRRIWDPVSQDLASAKTIFVVADGSLNLVSLSTLPSGKSAYLIEGGPMLHYLSAERDLLLLGTPPKPGQGLLVVGGAAYDDASLFASVSPGRKPATPASATAASTGLRGERPACDDFRNARFEPLPESEKEAAEVSDLWKKSGQAGKAIRGAGQALTSDVLYLTGPSASEAAFKRESRGKQVIHLATHGFFLGGECSSAAGTRGFGGLKAVGSQGESPASAAEENPLLLSGLALAGANHREAAGENEDDGILTAEEIASLDLSSVQWAVLSACDTGIGEVRGDEGVFGLRRAFEVAGVRTLIMSLWPIQDQSTREWMKQLYQGRLAGLSTAEAVRTASLGMIEQRRKAGQSTHPFYWGAFVAAGDWR